MKNKEIFTTKNTAQNVEIRAPKSPVKIAVFPFPTKTSGVSKIGKQS